MMSKYSASVVVLMALMRTAAAHPYPECEPCAAALPVDLQSLTMAGKFLCCDLTCATAPTPGCGVFGLPVVCKACYDGEDVPPYDADPVDGTSPPVAPTPSPISPVTPTPVAPVAPPVAPVAPVAPPTMPVAPIAPPTMPVAPVAPVAPPTMPVAPVAPPTMPVAPIAPPTMPVAPVAPPTMPVAPIAPPTMPVAPVAPPTMPVAPVAPPTTPVAPVAPVGPVAPPVAPVAPVSPPTAPTSNDECTACEEADRVLTEQEIQDMADAGLELVCDPACFEDAVLDGCGAYGLAIECRAVDIPTTSDGGSGSGSGSGGTTSTGGGGSGSGSGSGSSGGGSGSGSDVDDSCSDEEIAKCADISPAQAEALALYDNGGKVIVCDPTCTADGGDPSHCNYFGLGQKCRGCGNCASCYTCP